MIITGNGDVGIGTTSPQARLHLEDGVGSGTGSLSSNNTFYSDRAGINYATLNANVLAGYTFNAGTSVINSGLFYDYNSDKLHLLTGGYSLTKGVITSGNGYTGINNPNPLETLDVDGAVRVGTTTGTNAGTIRYNGSDFEGYDGTSWNSFTSGGTGGSEWTQSGNNLFYNSGNVGIGTSNPVRTLDVDGGIRIGGFLSFPSLAGEIRFFNHEFQGYDGTDWLNLGVQSPDVFWSQVGNDILYSSGSAIVSSNFFPQARTIQSSGSFLINDIFGNNQTSITQNQIRLNYDDGIAAVSILDTSIILNNSIGENTVELIQRSQSSLGGEIRLRSFSGQNGVIIEGDENTDSGGQITLYDDSNMKSIVIDGQSSGHGVIELENNDFTGSNKTAIRLDAGGSNDEPFIQLRRLDGSEAIILDVDVSGNSRVSTDELEIKGGSDFAENFDITTAEMDPMPGMLVSIDKEHIGKLTISATPYDKKVAGIISGANGIKPGVFMGQKETIANGEYPIALSGRVYVYANDEGGKIEPGDLLTSSLQKGYAMKASDNEKTQGTVIGKAMSGIDENGFVLVLVNLQ